MFKKISAIFLLVFICCSVLFGTASAEEKKTVRVGYMDYMGFIEKIGTESYSGYGVAYLREVAKYADFKYEFVFDDWSNLLEKLQKGEIDLICTAQRTPEREKIYDFSDISIGNETTILYTWANNDNIAYDDYGGMNGAKAGLLKNSFQTELFEKISKEKNFSYSPVYFNSETEMITALKRKEVDILVSGSLALHPELKIVGEYGSDPFYFMVKKGNTAILDRINLALKEIKNTKPYFRLELEKFYYGTSQRTDNPLLTREELDFIKKAPVLTVGSFSTRDPLSYVDEDGNLKGITIDVLNLISKKTGLKFKYEKLPLNKWPIELIKEGKYDLIAGIMRTDSNLSDSSLLVTETLQTFPLVSVGRKSDNVDRKTTSNGAVVAINTAYMSLSHYLSDIFPNITLKKFDTTEDCLKAVQDKKADVVIQNMYVVSELLAKPQYQDLEMVPLFSKQEITCIVGQSTQNKLLFSVLDKAIATLDENDLDQIIIKHTIARNRSLSATDFMYKYQDSIFITVIALALLIGLLIMYMRNKAESLKVMSEKNVQLQTAIRAAEEANKAKTNFLSSMSHEIRTPLNAIVGITNIIKKKFTNFAEINPYLDKLSYSSNHLLELINDILDMSAIQKGKINIVNKRFDVRELLTSLTNIYYTRCKDKGVDFELEINNLDDEIVLGDQLRTHQILNNLLSNAYKFTPSGKTIKLIATEIKKEEKTATLEFKVEDTGEGMTEDMQKRLFLPFEQENGTTALNHGGSGLGMSICKNLVELMHGRINCTSVKGEGTTFVVSLTFDIINEENNLPPENLEKYKVISMGDANTNLQLNGVLHRIGVNCITVDNEEELFNNLMAADKEHEPFNICFLDFDSTKYNANELVASIKKTYKDLFVVAETYSFDNIEKNLQGLNADYLMDKPIFQSSVFNLFLSLTGEKLIKDTSNREETYDFTGKKVLLVEDNELNLEIATELLQMVNLTVDTAGTGKEAVEKFNSSQVGEYAMIFMDVFMPIMDGIEATKVIRASSREDANTIPIVAMTANAFTEDVAATREAGMNGHVSKPIDVGVLYKTIQKYLENK